MRVCMHVCMCTCMRVCASARACMCVQAHARVCVSSSIGGRSPAGQSSSHATRPLPHRLPASVGTRFGCGPGSQVYGECLKVVPHKQFTFSKLWLMAAHFEVPLSRATNFCARSLMRCPCISRLPRGRILTSHPQVADCIMLLHRDVAPRWHHSVGSVPTCKKNPPTCLLILPFRLVGIGRLGCWFSHRCFMCCMSGATKEPRWCACNPRPCDRCGAHGQDLQGIHRARAAARQHGPLPHHLREVRTQPRMHTGHQARTPWRACMPAREHGIAHQVLGACPCKLLRME